MINNFLDYICCPKCKNNLRRSNKYLICKGCSQKLILKNGIIISELNLITDTKLSFDKWDKIYSDLLKNKKYFLDFKNYKKISFQKDFNQLSDARKIDKKSIFLELGCGMFFIDHCMSKKSKLVIGVDFSFKALMIAKKLLDKYRIKNYLLIHAGIENLPIKKNVVDFVDGNGVIEHMKDTQTCLDELYRITKKGGVSYNTVPLLNIGSLTCRQLWGNIPDFPILKQLAEFIHIKLLQGKHMAFGYELSFTKKKLIKLHHDAGFRKINITKLDVDLVFLFAPKFLRKTLASIANSSSLFWPMVKVSARK